MNLLLAISSFFSAVLLPGAIIYRIFIKEKFIISTFIVYSFIFSLCFNFVLIYALILSGIYKQSIISILMILEWIAFIYLFKNEIKSGIKPPSILQSNKNEVKIIFALSVLMCLFMLNSVFKADIFYAWDAVVSWNRWATELASGKFVLNEGGYPQLYPMLISLGYVASGQISSFQGIGVAIWHYFAFAGIVCSAFILIKDSTNEIQWSVFGLATSIIAYMVFFKLSNQFFIGYVDMPVAMVILISALLLIKASIELGEDSKNNAHLYLILSSFAAGISTEIKQAGLFYIVIYSICLFYLWYKHKIKNMILLTCIAIVITFVAPWIIIAIYKKIALNTDATNASYTMSGIYGDVTPIERLLSAIKSYKAYFALFFISIFSITSKNRIFSIFGISSFLYFIFWGCFLSYDLRNLQAGMPLMVIAFSYIVYTLIMKVNSINLAFKFIPMAFMMVAIIGMIFGFFAQESILKGEYKRKMTLGGKDINEIVLNAYKTRGAKTLLTSNQLIAFTPEFNRQYYKLYHFGESIKDGEFENYANNLKNDIGTFYILIPNEEFKRYQDFLKDSTYLGGNHYYTFIEF